MGGCRAGWGVGAAQIPVAGVAARAVAFVGEAGWGEGETVCYFLNCSTLGWLKNNHVGNVEHSPVWLLKAGTLTTFRQLKLFPNRRKQKKKNYKTFFARWEFCPIHSSL